MADELMGLYEDMEGEDDIMGEEEILGEDDMMGDDLVGYEIVGRRPRLRKHALRRTSYTRDRGLLLGFGRRDVPAKTTLDFIANPQVPFRPKRIIIDPTESILVEDIKVGKNSQLVTAGAFPATAFAAQAFDIGIKFDTAFPGIDITVTITNGQTTTVPVAIGMFGFAAER